MHFFFVIAGLILIAILIYALRWVIIGLLGLLVCIIVIGATIYSCTGPHSTTVSEQLPTPQLRDYAPRATASPSPLPPDLVRHGQWIYHRSVTEGPPMYDPGDDGEPPPVKLYQGQ
jgi:hypothetical protein